MRKLLCLLLAMTLGACATPPEAKRAAQRGVAAASGLATTIERYDAAQRAIESKRIVMLEDLQEAGRVAGSQAVFEASLAASGQERTLAAIKTLQLRAKLQQAAEQANTEDAARQAAIIETLSARVTPPGKKIRAASASFSAMASELTDAERARIGFAIAAELYADIEQAREATESTKP